MTELDAQVAPTVFKSLMAAFPSGVAVITAGDRDGVPHGMTCSALCSVAVEPPTLLVSLRRGATARAVLRSGAFVVNLLHAGAEETAGLFSGTVTDRFARVAWRNGASGPRLTCDAHRVADCVVTETVDVGDHTVVFGHVVSAAVLHDRPPLLYGMRGYRAWPRGGRVALRDGGALPGVGEGAASA